MRPFPSALPYPASLGFSCPADQDGSVLWDTNKKRKQYRYHPICLLFPQFGDQELQSQERKGGRRIRR